MCRAGASVIDRSYKKCDKALGMRIKARRIALGMTQRALAKRIGTTYQQLQHWENGEISIKMWAIAGIAQALKTTPSTLVWDILNKKQKEKRK